jgi:light-regulated signal transduction histidine kinase (bacteriophytochrome)
MSYGQPTLQQWIAWLEQRLQLLEQRQQELESANKQLKEQVESANKQLKEQLEGIQPVQCGNITYKVQELHVKELTGTLNIGLTSLAEEGQLKDMIGHIKAEHMKEDEGLSMNNAGQ